ncbi:hypothetical protein C8R48DRAFT_29481 [Suillus tomentosus]|nr:hypothetical protein C8R48DRAFT_29481 [Suillus tomentosus]
MSVSQQPLTPPPNMSGTQSNVTTSAPPPTSTLIRVLMRLAGTSHDAFLEGIRNSESTDWGLSEPLKYARYTSFGLLVICSIAGRAPLAPIAYVILSNCQMLAALGVITSWHNLVRLRNLKGKPIQKIAASRLHWFLLAFTNTATATACGLIIIYIFISAWQAS